MIVRQCTFVDGRSEGVTVGADWDSVFSRVASMSDSIPSKAAYFTCIGTCVFRLVVLSCECPSTF